MGAHYNQIDQEWWLHNSNCHKMVQIVTKIVKNVSSLRIEAPEWHPNSELITPEIKSNKDGKVNIESKVKKSNVVNKCDENGLNNNGNNDANN